MRDGVPSTPLGAVRVSPAAELLRVGDNVAPRAIDPSSRTPAASSRASTRRWQRVCVFLSVSLPVTLSLRPCSQQALLVSREPPSASCGKLPPPSPLHSIPHSLLQSESHEQSNETGQNCVPLESSGAESRDESSAQHAEGSSDSGAH